MNLNEDELNKIKLMLIENNKSLIQELKGTFVEKASLYKILAIISFSLIGLNISQIQAVLAAIF